MNTGRDNGVDGIDNDDPDGDPEMTQDKAVRQPDQAEGDDDAAETGG
ncbi:hypothetical protein SAMN04489835_4029 [Mycolicibacterium rutilum]|uniref:Uncharacterized protein n=1 Tax=Mycolicibacterium rutilum TaxID=370526 RepID=A0A1H6L129_MYCRU|nr:hypothetical protein [Mycolicibacterium rutilum]SEH77881.1 hypothetical protein SAMN04489835_4029 [Mycolicibacterium rutilum]